MSETVKKIRQVIIERSVMKAEKKYGLHMGEGYVEDDSIISFVEAAQGVNLGFMFADPTDMPGTEIVEIKITFSVDINSTTKAPNTVGMKIIVTFLSSPKREYSRIITDLRPAITMVNFKSLGVLYDKRQDVYTRHFFDIKGNLSIEQRKGILLLLEHPGLHCLH